MSQAPVSGNQGVKLSWRENVVWNTERKGRDGLALLSLASLTIGRLASLVPARASFLDVTGSNGKTWLALAEPLAKNLYVGTRPTEFHAGGYAGH